MQSQNNSKDSEQPSTLKYRAAMLFLLPPVEYDPS